MWCRVVLDTNGVVLLRQAVVKFDVLTPDGVAYDWIHHNLYWTDAGSDRIDVLSLRNVDWVNYDALQHDVLHRRTIISTALDEPRALVVDPRPKHKSLSTRVLICLFSCVFLSFIVCACASIFRR